MSESDPADVTELVAGAIAGSRASWDEIVVRFMPLVLATARRYRLGDHDAADVAQTVWLHLVEHLGDLREPAALPGWLVSTTRHECARVVGRKVRQRPYDPQTSVEIDVVSPDFAVELTDDLEQFARHEAILAGFAELSDSDRQLLVLLAADPPVTYAQISERLQIPIGSIGPTRGRALKRLRATAPVSQLVDSDS